jgi:hypothetical protein
MPRLLVAWLQIHPSIGEAGRIQAGAHLAVDSTDYKVGRRFEPDTDIDLKALDERLAASPVSSVAKLMEHVAAIVARETGQPTSVAVPTPPPEPAPAVEEREEITATNDMPPAVPQQGEQPATT